MGYLSKHSFRAIYITALEDSTKPSNTIRRSETDATALLLVERPERRMTCLSSPQTTINLLATTTSPCYAAIRGANITRRTIGCIFGIYRRMTLPIITCERVWLLGDVRH